MPIISAVGLFCCDKFEETPNKKVSDLSKLTKPYFSLQIKFVVGHKKGSLIIITDFHCDNANAMKRLGIFTEIFGKIFFLKIVIFSARVYYTEKTLQT